MSNLIPFNFDNYNIRVITDEHGEPQFVAKDIAEALEYVWNGAAMIKHVPEEWRGVTSVLTPSGQQEMLVLSEQGLYFFLGRSDKPKALPLQKMVAGEILPSIRKTGSYSVKGEATEKTSPALDAQAAFKMMPMIVRAAKSLGLDKNSAAISANQAVFKITGTNVLLLLGQTHMESEKQELVFNVSDLADGISGVKMNKMLQAAGMQTNADGRWVPTDTGMKHCRIFDTGKRHSSGAPVQQLKWSRDVLSQLSIAEAA